MDMRVIALRALLPLGSGTWEWFQQGTILRETGGLQFETDDGTVIQFTKQSFEAKICLSEIEWLREPQTQKDEGINLRECAGCGRETKHFVNECLKCGRFNPDPNKVLVLGLS